MSDSRLITKNVKTGSLRIRRLIIVRFLWNGGAGVAAEVIIIFGIPITFIIIMVVVAIVSIITTVASIVTIATASMVPNIWKMVINSWK